MAEIASRLGVGRTTLYRTLGRARAVPVTAEAKAIGTRAPGRKARVVGGSGKGRD